MARVAEIFDGDFTGLGNTKLPLYIDDALTMVMEMDAEYVTESVCPSKQELDKFLTNYRSLSKRELDSALRIENKEFIAVVRQMVPCIGCRRSAESLYLQVSNSGVGAFYPMYVSSDGSLHLDEDKRTIVSLWNLFYSHSKHMQVMLNFLEKSKSGRRCEIHSLETQRFRAVTSWLDVWEFMDDSCQDHCTIIDNKTMTTTLEQYLIKHRFCIECKNKVLQAYHILLGELDPACDAGFVPDLYRGLETCKKDHHIHVVARTSFITSLITRCVPELAGSRRERHAKTMEIAQEEVLICLGLCVFERLHRIQQRFCAEERAWEIIMCVGSQAFKRSFDVAVEKKRGNREWELLFKEFEDDDKAKEKSKKAKKSKKKNGNKVQQPAVNVAVASINENSIPQVTQMSETQNVNVGSKKSGKKKKARKNKGADKQDAEISSDKSEEKVNSADNSKSKQSCCSPVISGNGCSNSVSGIDNENPSCSSPEGSETLSSLGSEMLSSEGSVSLSSEGLCTHPFQKYGTGAEACCKINPVNSWNLRNKLPSDQPYRSLEEQLDDSSDLDDDFESIPEEEVSAIYEPNWKMRREALRQNFRIQFDKLLEANNRARLMALEGQSKTILQNSSAKSNSRPGQEPLVNANKENSKMSQGVNEIKVEEANEGKENQKSVKQGGPVKKSRQGQGGQCSRRYKGKNRR